MGYMLFEPCLMDSRERERQGKREREREKKKDLRWKKHGRVRHLGSSREKLKSMLVIASGLAAGLSVKRIPGSIPGPLWGCLHRCLAWEQVPIA